ncbi:MAG: zf-HC2 domain-containing protein [Phycisphaerae bacterium]
MTCSEAREYLFAFLDSELEAPLSIELQLHLDGCEACAREAEIERTTRTRLVAAAERACGAVPPLDTATAVLGVDSGESRTVGPVARVASWVRGVVVRPGRAGGAAWSRRRLVRWGVGSVAGVVGLWWLVAGALWPATPRRFAEMLVGDFEHFVAAGRRVELASSDPDTVAAWLRRRTLLGVTVPQPADARWRLVGARRCTLAGRAAAFAVYDVDGAVVSLVATSIGDRAFSGMTDVRRAGRRHWRDHHRGYTVVACRRGALAYAAVSTLAEEELIVLMSGIQHEDH